MFLNLTKLDMYHYGKQNFVVMYMRPQKLFIQQNDRYLLIINTKLRFVNKKENTYLHF